MDYKRIYNSIIDKRKKIPATGYTEVHHILPRALGGDNSTDNLVRLTAKEHFICHLLLTKIYTTGKEYRKMVCAFIMMSVVGSTTAERYVSSREYARLRADWARIISELQSGSGNSQFGKFWVSNPDTGENYKILCGDVIPLGFYPGRNLRRNICIDCQVESFSRISRCVDCHARYKQELEEKRIERKNRPPREPKPKKPKKPRIEKIEKNCLVCKGLFKTAKEGGSEYCSRACYNKLGNPSVARKVIDDSGRMFSTLTEASKHYDITVEAIRYRIKIGRYKYGE